MKHKKSLLPQSKQIFPPPPPHPLLTWRVQVSVLAVLIYLLIPLLLPFHSSSGRTEQPQSIAVHTTQIKHNLLLQQVLAQENTTDFCLDVPVIMYHHIQPLYISSEYNQEGLTVGVEYFDMHMSYLASQGYHTLSADQLVEALVTGQQLPPKSILVTLDDGYEDNYTYALPILDKYHIVANFMIPTGLVGTHSGDNTYVTWGELEKMAKDPLVHLYSHTVHHVDVGNSSKEIDEQEIGGAKQTLSQKLGVTSPIFTYPYGSTSETARAVLKEDGYVAAFTTQAGEHECRSQLLDLPRNHVGNLPLSEYGL